MKNPLLVLLSVLFLCVSGLAGKSAGQVRQTPTQSPAIETTPRILDILGKIRRQSDALRTSVDDTVRAISQARGRIAAGTPDDKQRALAVVQQMMSKTLVLGKKSGEETAQLFDQIDAELTMLQRDGKTNADQVRRFKKNVEDEIGRQQTLLASVALAAENLNNVLPDTTRSQLPEVLSARNAVREALVDTYGQQHQHLENVLQELGTEMDSEIAELRSRVQAQAEDARFYANAFGQFAGQLAVQVETDRIRDNVSKRREEMDKVEEELTGGNQPINDLLRALREFHELQRAVEEDRRRQNEIRKKRINQ